VLYDSSYHHVKNRGLEGKGIFSGDKSKSYFLNLLSEKSKKLKIRLLGYCVMDNHYHLCPDYQPQIYTLLQSFFLTGQAGQAEFFILFPLQPIFQQQISRIN